MAAFRAASIVLFTKQSDGEHGEIGVGLVKQADSRWPALATADAISPAFIGQLMLALGQKRTLFTASSCPELGSRECPLCV
jgi:hypothetical protein